MRIIYGSVLAILYSISFAWSYRVTKDVFSPMCFFPFMQLVAYVPGIMFFDAHLGVYLDEVNTFYVFVVQIAVLFFTCMGVAIYNANTKGRSFHYEITQVRTRNMTWVGLVLYVTGLIAMSYFIHTSGGISCILTNTQIEYATGRSYLWSLHKLMVIGILCFFQSRKKPSMVLLTTTFLTYACTIIIFTKRAPILEALLVIIMAWHYRVKKLRIVDFLRPRTALIALMVAILVVALPTLRNPLGFSTYHSRAEFLGEGWRHIDNIFREYSFVSRDAFVYSNYDVNNMYFGRTIINLVAAPLPSSVFNWKPPVDDGIYLANFINGHYVCPPSKDYPIENSIPFSSQGSMFANFGIAGVVAGSLLMGIMYARSYAILRDTNYHVLAIFTYQTIMYKFGLSAKNVIQTLTVIVLGTVFFGVFTGSRIRKRRIQIEAVDEHAIC